MKAKEKRITRESIAQEDEEISMVELEQDDAQTVARVKKPAVLKVEGKRMSRQASAEEDEGVSMAEVVEDLEGPLIPQRPQTSSGKLKAVGRRSMIQD